MSLFSIFSRRSNKVQNNGKPIKIPAPPVITVDREMTGAEAASAIAMARVRYIGRGEIYPLAKGFRDMLDTGYFSILDSDIPALAKWFKACEDSLQRQGYGYSSEDGDCDDRADSAQSYRRYFRRTMIPFTPEVN